jgi:hypothetical protein
LFYPADVAVDNSGNVYIADYLNSRIRVVNTSGTINTYAGNGTTGYSGDGGAATTAELYNPQAVKVDAAGNLFIADVGNQRIRKVSASGIITTIAGDGVAGYSGDGGPATAAELDFPSDVTMDKHGNVFIADDENNRVREVTATLSVKPIAAEQEINIYPNPAHGYVTIAAPGINSAAFITLTDVTGRALLSQNTESNTHGLSASLNTSGLAPGMYFVNVRTDDGNYVRKIVKE